MPVDRTLLSHFSGVASAGALGFVAASRGAVTQATSKATGVTVDAMAGAITTHAASLAAAAEVSFTVTNASVKATDVVVASIASGATAGGYAVQVDAVADGSFRVSLSNQSAGALAEAIVITFAVISTALV